MPRHNMDTQRSQWEPVRRSPWIMRVAVEQSPASSGAESDTEGSSTESEQVNVMLPSKMPSYSQKANFFNNILYYAAFKDAFF